MGACLSDGPKRVAAFRTALFFNGAASWVVSEGWCFGTGEWIILMILEHSFQFIGVELLLGSGVPFHLTLTLIGSVISYVWGVSSKHTVQTGDSGDANWPLKVIMMVLLLVGGMVVIGLLNFDMLRRKLQVLWKILTTPESHCEGGTYPVLTSPCARSNSRKLSSLTQRSASASSTGKRYVRAEFQRELPFDGLQILRQIGHGSFGTVYYGTLDDTPVAIKLLRWGSTTYKNPSAPRDEAELGSSLVHPFLVRTLQHKFVDLRAQDAQKDVPQSTQMQASHEFECWMVQQWCDRGTLMQYCSVPRYDEASIPEVRDILADISSGGAYLHSQSIIHGDLTGNNVLLASSSSRKSYDCKICDFGFSRMLSDEKMYLLTTQIGTVSHMPPELLGPDREREAFSAKVDVYSAGILLWVALLGQVPWSGLFAPQVILKISNGERLVLPPEVPDRLQKIYHQCTDMEAAKRPTFAQLNDAFKGV